MSPIKSGGLIAVRPDRAEILRAIDYCDWKIAEIAGRRDRAVALEATDPAASNREWRLIRRAIKRVNARTAAIGAAIRALPE